MSSINPLSSSATAAARFTTTATNPASRDATSAAGATAASSPSSIVTLSAGGLAAAGQDAATLPLSARFRDVGAALLESFKSRAAVPVSQAELPKEAENRFTLSIVTAAGTKVDLALATLGKELLVQVSADAELSGAEREALAGLANGFQNAIDGLTLDNPQLRLGGLANIDTAVLGSIDLHASVTLPTTPPATQTLDFHIDAARRSAVLDGPEGKLDVTVNTATLDGLGTRQQQQKAIDSYLTQFDQAAARGRGNAHLVSMFKDAFSDLSRTATRDGPAVAAAGAGSVKSWSLSRDDRAMLTGLADFTASVTQAPEWNNPVRRDEVDGFAYEASQQTSTSGASFANRSVAQVQQSKLKAQFHEPLEAGGELAFDFSAQSQNYRYHQIDDSASSTAALGYRDGKLLTATLAQSVSQSERVREYVLGREMSDKTIPSEQRLMRDLVAALAPYKAGAGDTAESREAREERRQRALEAFNGNVLLLGSSSELAARDASLPQLI